MYEIATIGGGLGASGETSARVVARRPVTIGALPSLDELVTMPVLVGAGAGLVVGVVLGALLFGGRRG